jgi:hypothetical protein
MKSLVGWCRSLDHLAQIIGSLVSGRYSLFHSDRWARARASTGSSVRSEDGATWKDVAR